MEIMRALLFLSILLAIVVAVGVVHTAQSEFNDLQKRVTVVQGGN